MRKFIIAAAISLPLILFASTAEASHVPGHSGAEYLAALNQHLQSKGLPIVNPQSGAGRNLIRYIDGPGYKLSDAAYDELMRVNAQREAAGNVWARNPQQISAALQSLQIDPQTGKYDLTKPSILTSDKPPSDECTSWFWDFSFHGCIWKPFMSALGGLIMQMGAAVFQLAGSLFSTLVQHVIVGYGETMRTLSVMDAINKGWTVFRDFSNILIIGFFIFIAISIILGLSEFGQKRLIANVLVIAVLMNFSLLFTKLIIDGSNFVAYQVYSQMAATTGSTVNANFNIAETFLKPMKIGSLWDTYPLVEKVAKETNSGWRAFAFGLVGGAMLLLLAFVLFYGSFLIAWRGILFIVLMLTAPLAFATYLIPTLAKGEYGWDSWWKMLINNAAFGPLLMILLALSLAIVNAAGSKTGSTTLGQAVADPTKVAGDSWTIMLVYIIGTGLLFVSLKLASSFAGSIGGGFNAGWGITKLLSLTPIGAAGAIAGGGMRRFFGGRAARRSLELDGKIEEQRENVRMAPNDALRFQENQKLMALIKQKGKADAGAKREYNFDNTSLGKALQKAGMPTLSGETKGGFEGPRKKAAEEAANSTESAIVSNKQAEDIARRTMDNQQEAEKRQLEEQKSTNEQLIKAAQSVAESVKHSENLHTQREEAFKTATLATQNKVQADADHKEGKIDTSKREEIMREEDQRIKEANEKIRQTSERMTEIDKLHLETPHLKMAQEGIRKADDRLRTLAREHEEGVKDLRSKIVEASVADAQGIAADIHHLDSYEREVTGKKLRDRLKDKRIKDQLRVMKTLDESSDDKKAT